MQEAFGENEVQQTAPGPGESRELLGAAGAFRADLHKLPSSPGSLSNLRGRIQRESSSALSSSQEPLCPGRGGHVQGLGIIFPRPPGPPAHSNQHSLESQHAEPRTGAFYDFGNIGCAIVCCLLVGRAEVLYLGFAVISG